MGMLATLFECDNCKKVMKVQTDEEWKSFDSKWENAGDFDFCEKCKNIPQIKIFAEKENSRFNLAVFQHANMEVSNNAKL